MSAEEHCPGAERDLPDPLETRSVTQWCAALRDGDDGAAASLWNRYFSRLVELARQRLGSFPGPCDAEDVAVSVFKSLCLGAERGAFDLAGREELWRLLVVLTQRKAADRIRSEGRQKRGGLRVRNASDSTGDLDRFAAEEPTPEELAELSEEHDRRMALLDSDEQRSVVALKLEGYTNAEIAIKLNLSLRSVERKLMMVRALWSRELEMN